MSTIRGLRRPAYTGANRCWPCTVVNLAILAGVIAVVAPFWPIGAALVGIAGAAVIWLRGYLVPYTPQFAPKLAARLPGSLFEHPVAKDSLEDVHTMDADGRGGRKGDADGEDVLEALVAAGVVTVADDQLGLRDDIATAWRARMAELSESTDALVEAAERDVEGIDSARIEVVDGETHVVVTGGSTAWLPEAVAVAEIGAVQVLAETDLPAGHRELAAHSLCAFLDTCPVCGDDVVEGAADDCCGHTVPDPGHDSPTVLACERCGVAFYTLEGGADAEA